MSQLINGESASVPAAQDEAFVRPSAVAKAVLPPVVKAARVEAPVAPVDAVPPTALRPGRRLRIMFLDHTAALSGGEIALLNLVRHLDSRRYVPSVVLFSDGPLAQSLREARIPTHLIPLSGRVIGARKDALGGRTFLRVRDVFSVLSFIQRLAHHIREQMPDVVHTNSLKADLIGGLAARLVGVPVLWHIRDRISSDYLPAKVVRLFRFLTHRIPHFVVANSETTLQTLLRRPGAAPPGWMRVVHDGTPDVVNAAVDVCPREAGSDPIIGLVGRISRWKGQDVFLRAAARVLKTYPAARFQIIGSPLFGEVDYEREIRELAVALGIAGRVEFTGFRSDVAAMIARLDLLVHASVTGEPFGQVIIEGMAAAKPIVATQGGAIPEIVIDGITGLMVPMGDIAAMAAAIESMLANPLAARRMGLRGLERVISHFTIQATAQKIQNVYEELVLAD